MSVNVRLISLWPAREALEPELRKAIEQSSALCPADEAWDVVVYQGPELGGGETKISVLGSQPKAQLESEWQAEAIRDQHYVYSTTFTPLDEIAHDTSMGGLIRRRLEQFLSLR